MTDVWYYAEGEETCGPLSIGELVPLLVRIADPRRVMVWRQGFTDWKMVEEVREVAQHVFRPPPLRRTPPAVPQVPPPPKVREPVVDAEDAAHFKNVKPELTGLGGWLGLLVFGEVMGLLKFVVALGEYYSAVDARLWTAFPTAMWGEVLMNVGLMWLFVYTMVLLFRHSRHFPRFFILQFVAVICTPIVAGLWAGVTIGLVIGTPIRDFMALGQKEGGQLAAAIIGAAIWIPYILRSRRVRNTFTV